MSATGDGGPALGPLGPTLAELRLADALEGDLCPSCERAFCTSTAWCPACSRPWTPTP
jgi:predicted amidophosphoribosyltransferase